MPYHTPGVYIEEVPTGPRPIQGVSTTTLAILGVAPKTSAFVNEPRPCNSFSDFARAFMTEDSKANDLACAVYGFFQNGGSRCYVVNVGSGNSIAGDPRKKTGIHALEAYDEPAIVCAPGCMSPTDHNALIDHCEKMQDRFAILDGPASFEDTKPLIEVATVSAGGDDAGDTKSSKAKETALRARATPYAAQYVPHLVMRNPFGEGTYICPPSAHIAGIYARTDTTRGVHKAPANAALRACSGLSQRITREEQGVLNDAGVNCIRYFTDAGIRVWGARTLAEDAQWRYVNVRRLFNFIEESIAEGTNWTVFEPNDVTLWKSIIRDVTAFLSLQWQSGALVGASAAEAFFVRCDAELNPAEVRDAGRLIVEIGIAPVKPAEFIIFRIGQWSGGTEVELAA